MLVTRTKYGLLVMVYIEKDVAVVFVPRDEALCNEIRIRSLFFRQVLLPQLVSGHFYAGHGVDHCQISENVLIEVPLIVDC